MIPDPTAPTHAIKIVSQRTGLSPHAIRVWERRYDLVCCNRTDTNRRLYSEQDIEHLTLLKKLTDNGHKISRIAPLTLEQLRELQAKDKHKPLATLCEDHDTPESCLDQCYIEVVQMNIEGLVRKLEEARQRYGTRNVLLRIATPLIHIMSEKVHHGQLSLIQEYVATNAIRDFIAIDVRNRVRTRRRPEIVICNPLGELREIGANIATALSRDFGWNATYIGRDLTAELIAQGVKIRKAKAIGIGLTLPTDPEATLKELQKLNEIVPPEIHFVIGGPKATEYFPKIPRANKYLVENLKQLETIFEDIENKSRHAKS